MSDELCEMFELPKSQCAHCLGHKLDLAQPKGMGLKLPANESHVFIARYEGPCAAQCGEPILEGDHIQSAGHNEYSHYGCA